MGSERVEAGRDAILKEFALGPGDLLGAGGESWVYGLDDDRVLRISKGPVEDMRWYFERLKAFYGGLPERHFAFPVIHEVAELGGALYSIENRLRGAPLTDRLPGLGRADKARVLENYLAAVETLKDIVYPESPYGEMFLRAPLTAPTWRGFLSAQVERVVAADDPHLRRDVPALAEVVEETLAGIAALPDPPKALVHGDYFPGNMLVGDDLQVTAILDFSPLTVIGDPLMDVAGGLIFLEVDRGYVPENVEILRAIVHDRYGSGIDDAIGLYRLYYSFYFSGVGEEDEGLYRWCVDNLNRLR